MISNLAYSYSKHKLIDIKKLYVSSDIKGDEFRQPIKDFLLHPEHQNGMQKFFVFVYPH